MAVGLKMVHGPQHFVRIDSAHIRAPTSLYKGLVFGFFFVCMKGLPILNLSMLLGGCMF